MTRLAFSISLIVAGLASVAAQDRTPSADSVAIAVIAGQVVTADTGTPIRGAQVRLRATTGGDTRLVTTDERGQFEARNLFTGSWLVSVSKSGFITTNFGQRRSSDEARRINLSANQRVTVSIALPRAGAITGRVLDEFGEPLLGARIQAMKSRVVRGVRQLAPGGASDSTDDTGAFRLFGLSPGTYYVTAMLRASTPDTDNFQNTIGAMTYYPGTTDVAYAQPIIMRGSEESIISFQVTPVRSVSVTGTVYGASGTPAGDVDVHLMRLDNSEVGTTVGNFGRSGGDGSFRIINVPPGPYVLRASRMGPMPARPPQGSDVNRLFEEAMTPITVGNDDVSGVALAMSFGVTVTGTIVAENGMPLPSPLRMEINGFPPAGFGRNPATIQITRSAGQPMTFQMPGMFWSVTLAVTLPDGLMLSAIEANGVDVTDKPIELRGASPEIRVVLSTRVTEVAGVVSRDRAPASNTSVIIFPDNADKWTFPSRYIALADTDERGRFLIKRLPPDERYLAAVVSTFDDGDQYDAEFLNSLRERASAFTLRDGERKTLELTER